MHTQINNSILK